MSATIQDTASVSRSKIVELVAAIQAAADLVALEDKRLSRNYRADAIFGMANRFRREVLGPFPEDDDARATDPTEVELYARAAEFEAEMIDAVMQQRVRGAETRAHLESRDGRSAKLRFWAGRVREAGNADSPHFPTDSEMSERVRAAMNAPEASDAS